MESKPSTQHRGERIRKVDGVLYNCESYDNGARPLISTMHPSTTVDLEVRSSRFAVVPWCPVNTALGRHVKSAKRLQGYLGMLLEGKLTSLWQINLALLGVTSHGGEQL